MQQALGDLVRPRPKGMLVSSGRFLAALTCLTALALAVRILVCHHLRAVPAVCSPPDGTDMETYFTYARDILAGRFPEYYYYQPFYYAVFLPLVLLFSMGRVWAVGLAQSLIGAACVWLTGLSTARLFGRRAGIVAAALLAVCRFHIFYTPFMLMAVLQSFWMALLLYLSLKAYRRNVISDWLWVGLTLCAAILTRGNAVLFLPGLLALLIWRNRSRRGFAVGAAALVLLAVWLPQLPFSVMNYHHYGRWTGPSSAKDAVLALGNTPEAPPGGLAYPETYEQWMRKANLPAEERTPVSKQILGWALREPVAFADLKWRTLLLFWNRMEVPNNVNIGIHGRESWLLAYPILPGFGLYGTLGLAGLLACRQRRSPGRLFWIHLVVVYCLGTVIFYMLARFRVPVLPLLCISAGAFVDRIVRLGRDWWRADSGASAKERLRRRALFTTLTLVTCVWVVHVGFTFYERHIGPGVLRWGKPHGVAVRRDDGALVYDHAIPAPTGWQALPLEAGRKLRLRKTFSPPRDVLAEDLDSLRASGTLGMVGVPGSKLIFYPPGASEDQGHKAVFPRRRGVQWVGVPITGEGGETPMIELDVLLLDGAAAIAVDNRRNYGRSTVDGQVLDSEIVAKLKFSRR